MFHICEIFLTVNGKFLTSSGRQSKHPVVLLAVWDENLFGSTPSPLPTSSLLPSSTILRPVCVHYYMKISYCVETSVDYVFFANVSWFYPHPDRDALGKPAELWCPSSLNILVHILSYLLTMYTWITVC